MSDRDTPEWQSAVDRALEEAGHGVHGGYDITADGIIVCAWDGEPIAKADTPSTLLPSLDHMRGDAQNMELLTAEEHAKRHHA